MLWYRYILFDWDKSLFGFRHTRRNRRLQFYASYMNVFTPHPSPPLLPAWLMHDKYKRTYTSVAWRMRDKYKITYTSVAWRRRHNYKRTYTSVTWHMPEKYITWLWNDRNIHVACTSPPILRKLHERYYTPPHPFTQVTWTLLHPTPPLHASYMNVFTPHPTPPPSPLGEPPPPRVYIYVYIYIHRYRTCFCAHWFTLTGSIVVSIWGWPFPWYMNETGSS